MTKTKTQKPVRVGVFGTIADADRAVIGLQDAGFTVEHISVVCSDKTKEQFFKAFEHDLPAGATAGSKAVKGGLVGLIAGGLVAAVGIALTGGVGVVAVGPLLAAGAGTGGAAGSFIGAMSSRGVEHEVANFYDQALRGGEILVAAEVDPDALPDGGRGMLDAADRVFRSAGAKPMALPQG